MLIFVIFVYTSICLTKLSNGNYWEQRDAIIKLEQSQIVGSDIFLTPFEEEVNNILMKLKHQELDDGFLNPGQFLPAQHFFKSKDLIKKSKVFQFIEKMPKGCMLHGHDLSLTSFDYLFNLTYRENLYACEVDNKLKLHFFKSPVKDKTCDWLKLCEWRKKDPSFNDRLKSEMTIIVPNPDETYPDINVVWNKFSNIFPFIEPLLTYKEIFQEYFYQSLQDMYDDNVMYMEFRGYLPTVYDLNGRVYDQLEVVGLYEETLKQFMADHKDFQGGRLIYAPIRKVDNATMDQYILNALKFKKAYPNFVAGFDLVGQEDAGNPLIDFIPQLQNITQEMHVFFHAGETNWYGASTDLNLIDAVLLGAKRIGHGYALTKHPEVLKLIKQRNIGIEINPISNQVLKLVEDLRNHPACMLISQGYPIIISSDDPTIWGAKGISYDWYVAFMGMTDRNTDLRFLKQLAMNSYIYNSMNVEEKSRAMEEWRKKWSRFIVNLVVKETLSVRLIH